jgi:hypothetical protein
MELRAIVLIAGVFFCSMVSAPTPAWTIQPNICVAQRVGDECQLTFSIQTQNMPSEKLCLFLDGQLLNCSQQAYFYKETSILIKKNALIELKNRAQQTILSKKLLIKYHESNEQRRRIRPPWSLF